jgi:hypothetical protein
MAKAMGEEAGKELVKKSKAIFGTTLASVTSADAQTVQLKNAGGDIIGSANITMPTDSAPGLMLKSEKTKLAGIATGANAYILPTASASTLGGVKVGTNLSISSGVLSAKDTTYSNATASTAGLMSAADFSKLSNIDSYATSTKLYTDSTPDSNYLHGNIGLKGDGAIVVKDGSNDENVTNCTVTFAHSTASGYKHIPSGGSSGQILRWSADGTAAWGADNNTTYSAGTGIGLSGTTFSNAGVRSISTGSTNGTISVNTNGTSAEVSVKGLGSAAYTASTAYAAASHTHSYAGSSSAGGAATSANKLNTNAGSATNPVYFANGVPVKTSYTFTNATLGTGTTTIPTSKAVSDAIAAAQADAAMYQGTVTAADHATGGLPDTHKSGWYWVVAKAGTYAGEVCEVGDMIFCNTTDTWSSADGESAFQADFDVVQSNIDFLTAAEVDAWF